MADLAAALERHLGRAARSRRGGRPRATARQRARPRRVAIIGAGFGGIGLGDQAEEGRDRLVHDPREGRGDRRRLAGQHLPGRGPATSPRTSTRSRSSRTRTGAGVYSPQPEILAYLERCVERVRHRARTCASAPRSSGRDFDEEIRPLADRDGATARRIEADVLVSRLRPAQPAGAHRGFPGAERFEGPIFHSGALGPRRRPGRQARGRDRHRREHDPGRPGDRRRVEQLDVYQRSAPYVIPKKDRAYRPWEKRLFRLFPPGAAGRRGSRQWLFFEIFVSAFNQFRPARRSSAIRMFERNLDEQVSDPELRARL